MGSLKTQDIPVELRTWWKSFQVAAYRHDYSRVFDDFITMTLTQFVPPNSADGFFDQWHADAMKAYDRKEKDAFNEMFFEVIRVFNDQVTDKGKAYYDMFGQMYETISSNYKKSGLGQFFTPGAVVDVLTDLMTAELMIGSLDKEKLKGGSKRVLDPCCGSGRMLFIFHSQQPGHLLYGIDIDPICAKMSALNMMFHGCVGEVVCGNGLFLSQDWRWALAINPLLTHHGIPSLMKIEKDQSFVWRQEQEQIASYKKEAQPVPVKKGKAPKVPMPPEKIEKELNIKVKSQLSIFD